MNRIRQNKLRPIAAGLPEKCFAMHPTEPHIIVLERGVCTYQYATGPQATSYCVALGRTPPIERVDQLNAAYGVTPAQREAMLNGSLFGWNIPAADPRFWEERWKEQV